MLLDLIRGTGYESQQNKGDVTGWSASIHGQHNFPHA